MIDLLTDVFYGRYHCKLCLGIIFLKINGKIIVFSFDQLLKGVVWKCRSKMTLKCSGSLLFGIHPKKVNLHELFSNLYKVPMALGGYSNLETRITEFNCCLRVRSRSFQLTISTNFLSFYAAKVAWGHVCVGHFVFIL